jgi:hypothetical protein
MLKLNINEGGMGSTRATTFGEFGGSFCSGGNNQQFDFIISLKYDSRV